MLITLSKWKYVARLPAPSRLPHPHTRKSTHIRQLNKHRRLWLRHESMCRLRAILCFVTREDTTFDPLEYVECRRGNSEFPKKIANRWEVYLQKSVDLRYYHDNVLCVGSSIQIWRITLWLKILNALLWWFWVKIGAMFLVGKATWTILMVFSREMKPAGWAEVRSEYCGGGDVEISFRKAQSIRFPTYAAGPLPFRHA